MTKFLLFCFVITCPLSVLAMEDSESIPYIEMPKAIQVADLNDDDNDGVINARDKCTTTPKGVVVDNDGCEQLIKNTEQQRLHILFANDSSQIPPSFLPQIRRMADFLKLYPEATIQLSGYASKTGTSAYNQNLSEERSQAVRIQLIRFGIKPNRITILGYGDSNLLIDRDDQLSHAQNRRVTASVIGVKGDYLKEWTIFTTLPE
ncbi:OmpA family protein [Vibrio tritonius]|uniref:OmpA family protein n=1 Tax=Vibrio tritonius TaxID=1435069 RepID=UPI0008391496